MTVRDVREVLGARVLAGEEHLDREVKTMACKKQTVPFRGTPEQEAALKAVIADLKSQPGALMPVMQKAQEIYGYLPIEVQTIISNRSQSAGAYTAAGIQ